LFDIHTLAVVLFRAYAPGRGRVDVGNSKPFKGDGFGVSLAERFGRG